MVLREAPDMESKNLSSISATTTFSIQERSFDCVRAPAQTAGTAKTRANSAPFVPQGKQDDGGAKYEADGEQVAKHWCRAWHAMPLRRNGDCALLRSTGDAASFEAGGHITPSRFAGHSMLCPYEETATARRRRREDFAFLRRFVGAAAVNGRNFSPMGRR